MELFLEPADAILQLLLLLLGLPYEQLRRIQLSLGAFRHCISFIDQLLQSVELVHGGFRERLTFLTRHAFVLCQNGFQVLAYREMVATCIWMH